MTQMKKPDLRPPVKSWLNWDAITRTCKTCGQKSGRIDDTGVCAPCRGPVRSQVAPVLPARRNAACEPKPKPLGPSRPRRLPNDRNPVDEHAIIAAYRAGATAVDLARQHGCGARRIRSILDRRGVPRRDDRAARSGGKPRDYGDDLIERVRTLYLDEHLSKTEVARKIGQPPKTVHTIMRRHGIPARQGQSGRGDGALSLKQRIADLGVTSAQIKTWAVDCGVLPMSGPGIPSTAVVGAYEQAHRLGGDGT